MAIANISKRISARAFAAIAFGLLTSSIAARDAGAVPTLEIYIEPVSYEAGSENWLAARGNSSLWDAEAFNSGQSLQAVPPPAWLAAGGMATGPISLAAATTGHGGVTDRAAPAPVTLPYSIGQPEVTVVPEPSTLLGLGAALSLFGGAGFARRRRKA